jgi:hypothetical protein
MAIIPRHDEPHHYKEDFNCEYLIELQERGYDQPIPFMDETVRKIHIYWRNMDTDVIHNQVDRVPQDVVMKLAKDQPKVVKVCGVVIGEVLKIFLEDNMDDPIVNHEELRGGENSDKPR